MAKYGFMPGTHEENRENPPVRSKFDKSQGRGLPAPHMKFPGGIVKESGSANGPGFTEHGHMLPHHRDAQNTDRVSGVGTRKNDSAMHLREPDPVSAGHIKERPAASGFGAAHGKGSEAKLGSQVKSHSGRPQHQDNRSSRRSGPHAELDRVKMKS
jgi:hypothetical protein